MPEISPDGATTCWTEPHWVGFLAPTVRALLGEAGRDIGIARKVRAIMGGN
jgi:hypothetical protein